MEPVNRPKIRESEKETRHKNRFYYIHLGKMDQKWEMDLKMNLKKT